MFVIKKLRYKDILNIEAAGMEEGEITSIVGKSGSGKTTLLKMLNKMISPDEGDIFYQGKNLKEIEAVDLRREVVMLGQEAVVFPGTIRDNLLIGRFFAEKKEVSDRVLWDLLEDLGLEKSLDEEAEKLSGGEKQRLALGRVVISDPKVFLLDEPSSALDRETEYSIIQFLASYVRKNKKTLIMVTHSKEVGQEFSDRIIEIDAGRISTKEGR